MTVSDALRQTIQDSGYTINSIAKAAGVAQSGLSAFMAQKRGLSLVTVDRLARYFDLELVSRKGG